MCRCRNTFRHNKLRMVFDGTAETRVSIGRHGLRGIQTRIKSMRKTDCISRACEESSLIHDRVCKVGEKPDYLLWYLGRYHKHCYLSSVVDEEPWVLETRRAVTVGIYVQVYRAASFTTAPYLYDAECFCASLRPSTSTTLVRNSYTLHYHSTVPGAREMKTE